LFNRFKKCNEGGKQKKICKGEILKEFFARGKAKPTFFAGVNTYLFFFILKRAKPNFYKNTYYAKFPYKNTLSCALRAQVNMTLIIYITNN
jgi:hypothetical protein